MDNNMKIWDQVQETDPKFTKPEGNSGRTSINGTYMFKKATEIFGPVGIGWGYEIAEERFDDCAPFKDPVTQEIIYSQSHTIKLKFWYKQDDQKGEIPSFGHTKYRYLTRGANPYVVVDEEAPKKSLTDAIKKALSMLGFSGDVFMGEYDNREYVEELGRKSLVDHADDKDAEKLRQAKEYQEWLSNELKTYALIDDLKPLKTVYTGHMRKASRRHDSEGQSQLTKTYENRIKEIQECK